MPRSSSSSAGAVYLDKAQRIEAVRGAVRRAVSRVPSIRRAVLFGSLASGHATPRSDADLLIVVQASEHAQPRDRLPAMLAALSPLPCPIDVLVVTGQELEDAERRGDPLVREALAHGVELIG